MASNTKKIRARGKQGFWTIRYYDADGIQREESTGSTDYAEAARTLAEREDAVKKGAPITPKHGRFKFEDAEALILADYELNDHDSIDHLKRRIEIGLRPYFAHKRMARLTTNDVRKFAAARKRAGASNATINLELAALRRMLTLAVSGGSLLSRPRIETLTPNKPRKGFFEDYEFRAVLAALPAHHRPWAILAYYTGWRVKSDILPLEWSMIDRALQLITLPGDLTKNEEGRSFYYGSFPELVDALEACWTTHQTLKAAGILAPRVFLRLEGFPPQAARVYDVLTDGAWHTAPAIAAALEIPVHNVRTILSSFRTRTYDAGPLEVQGAGRAGDRPGRLLGAYRLAPGRRPTGTPCPIHGAYKAWRTATIAAGHPGKNPHDFRRTAVRNFDRAGVSRKVAKEIVGHKTDSVYDRYRIVNENDLREAAEQLAAGLARDISLRTALEAADQAAALRRGDQGRIQGRMANQAPTGRKAGKGKLKAIK